jgi:hypothetical protein
MKKKLSAFSGIGLFVISALFLFGGCTEDRIIDNPGYETQWTVFDITVSQGQWKFEDGGEYAMYYCEKNDSRFTAAIVDNGGVLVDRVIDNSFYRRLPVTEYLYSDSFGYYNETLDYEYGPGWIRFNLKRTDLFDSPIHSGSNAPTDMTFKVTLFY